MKSSGTHSDAALMTLIAQGDERAFEALYDRYKGQVYGLVLNIVGDIATTEEVTLDVFSQIWKHAISFQPQMASVKTWLTSIARHRAIDVLRRRLRRPDQQVPKWAGAQPSSLADPDDLETQFALHDLQVRVRAAIASLPADQQETLALAYFKGYSHQRIAETLKRPLGTVKTHIRKALQQLRERFSREQ